MFDELLPIINIDEYTAGNKILIAGPCSAESKQQILDCALKLKSLNRINIFRAGIWKPRTKPGSFEGVGECGLEWLIEAKNQTGIPVATEVATSNHVEAAIEACIDILWIGARTTTNPFAIQEIANTLSKIAPDKPVLIKNPINPDIELWIGAIQRMYNSGIHRLGVIHRGFGSYSQTKYRNRPIWQIPLELQRRIPGLTIIHDPSHAGGKREYLKELSQTAMDMGFNGLMIESHISPESALSDGGQQITPSELQKLLNELTIRTGNLESSILDKLRCSVDELDNELISILSQRMKVCREIGKFKKSAGMPIVQPKRYKKLLSVLQLNGNRQGLSEEFLKNILELIHLESVRQQLDIINNQDN